VRQMVPVRRLGAPTIRTPGMPVSRPTTARTVVFSPSPQRREGTIQSLPATSLSGDKIRKVVHRRRDTGHVGQTCGAELEPLGYLVGRRLELVGVKRLQQVDRGHDGAGVRTAPLVGGKGEEVGQRVIRRLYRRDVKTVLDPCIRAAPNR